MTDCVFIFYNSAGNIEMINKYDIWNMSRDPEKTTEEWFPPRNRFVLLMLLSTWIKILMIPVLFNLLPLLGVPVTGTFTYPEFLSLLIFYSLHSHLSGEYRLSTILNMVPWSITQTEHTGHLKDLLCFWQCKRPMLTRLRTEKSKFCKIIVVFETGLSRVTFL